MAHAPDPHPAHPDARAAHPSLSSLSEADATSALAGIRVSRRTRRRKAWLGAGDHGSATLLGAHRSGPGDWSTAPPAA